MVKELIAKNLTPHSELVKEHLIVTAEPLVPDKVSGGLKEPSWTDLMVLKKKNKTTERHQVAAQSGHPVAEGSVVQSSLPL